MKVYTIEAAISASCPGSRQVEVPRIAAVSYLLRTQRGSRLTGLKSVTLKRIAF